MWCLRARRLISAFHDKELDPPTERKVSAHVARCPSCSGELERVKMGAELASVYGPAGLSAAPRGQPPSLSADAPGKGVPLGLYCTAVGAALLLGAGIVYRVPLHDLCWRLFSGGGDCRLDLGTGGERRDALDLFRARYSARFREFPCHGVPDPGWVAFDYKFPSRVPGQMTLKSVLVFDPGCCGAVGLVYAGERRNLWLLQQPADRPMTLAGFNMDRGLVCRHGAAHGTVGRYGVDTWTADGLRYVLLSDLPHQEIEAVVASLRYVR